MACAAIQTSFVGMGRPLARSDAAILEYRSAVVSPTGTTDTYAEIGAGREIAEQVTTRRAVV